MGRLTAHSITRGHSMTRRPTNSKVRGSVAMRFMASLLLGACSADNEPHRVRDPGERTRDADLMDTTPFDADSAHLGSDQPDQARDTSPSYSRQCDMEKAPRGFDPETSEPFYCGHLFVVCIEDTDEMESNLNTSLSNIGTFLCGASESICRAGNLDCRKGRCCMFEQSSGRGITFEAEFYPDVCAATDVINGFGCVELD